jgi:predicted small lipoprotein YifL
MSRKMIARLLLAFALLSTVAACGKSPTAPDGQGKPRDTVPWN